MIKKNRILIYPLLIMGILFNLSISCKKDEVIIKKDITITWANPADIIIGTALSATQLNAAADVPGTFVYTPAIGTVLSIGTAQNLKVDFTPTDAVHNNTATKTVTINVMAKKIPIVTWANPADITVGTLLSATQLNATADVSGTFVYTPAIGTVLSLGSNQDLKVDFTPTDVASYNMASKTVKINVIANTFTDPRDGNVYHLVTIGTQVWMVENLRYLPSVVEPSTGSQTTPYYYVYDYNGTSVTDAKATANYTTYGVLYNWPAAMAGSVSSNTNPSGIQGVCPTGWHLPSDAEWTQLTAYLGGVGVAGGKLKATTLWVSSNTGATNETGFTALPGGLCASSDVFGYIGSHGFWWSATEYSASDAWNRCMTYSNSNVYRSYFDEEVGFSVRCLRD